MANVTFIGRGTPYHEGFGLKLPSYVL